MKISFLQLDLVSGDLEANARSIVQAIKKAISEGAELCITPELALIGYNVNDSLLYPDFQRRLQKALDMLASQCAEVALILGATGQKQFEEVTILLNEALFLYKGKILSSWEKLQLSAWEQKYFTPGRQNKLIEWKGKKLAVRIGDDLFSMPHPHGADYVINIAANPFNAASEPEKKLGVFASLHKCRLLYVNAVGGCDSLIFPGQSACFQPDGAVTARAKAFKEEILSFYPDKAACLSPTIGGKEEGIFLALCLGLRDYCIKSGISRVIIGLSGGVDSALVAVIACKALGSENVCGVLMPSPWSSDHSLTDAQSLAANLKIKTWLIPITNIMEAFSKALAPAFSGTQKDVTEENIQARIRGVLLMALANKFRALVLATGNKSEISVGYSTLYGDMCGALEVIGDLYKTEVYELCNWINAKYANPVPHNILVKEPSAELAPNQKDVDNLPPYPELDNMLAGMLDERLGLELMEKQGFARERILKVAKLVSLAQFKRAQSPPILQVYPKPLWNMPVSGKFPLIQEL